MGDNYYLPELETDKHVTKLLDAEGIEIGSEASEDNYNSSPVKIHPEPSVEWALVLDHDSDEQSGGNAIEWWADQQPLIRTRAHTTKPGGTQHNHWSLYSLKDTPVKDGGDKDTADDAKRLDVGLGADRVGVSWQNLSLWNAEADKFVVDHLTESVQFKDSSASSSTFDTVIFDNQVASANQEHQYVTDSDNNVTHSYRPQGGTEKLSIDFVPSRNEYGIIDRVGTAAILKLFYDTPQISLEQTPLVNINEYSNATASDLDSNEIAIDTNRGGTGSTAVLYDDGTNVNYWDADGTL